MIFPSEYNSKLLEFSLCTHPDSNEVIFYKFCTSYELCRSSSGKMQQSHYPIAFPSGGDIVSRVHQTFCLLCCCKHYYAGQAPVPLMIFWSNSKLYQNLQCSGLPNFVVIGWAYFKIEHYKFWSNFEFDRNTICRTGARAPLTPQPYVLGPVELIVEQVGLGKILILHHLFFLNWASKYFWICQAQQSQMIQKCIKWASIVLNSSCR